MHPVKMSAEQRRLEEDRTGRQPWRAWGPYLSERQWGTVREDYSLDGTAWEYLSHDQARSRAYRWGEDGLAGVCDAQARLCLGLALWNGRDPILKERLFGLTLSPLIAAIAGGNAAVIKPSEIAPASANVLRG